MTSIPISENDVRTYLDISSTSGQFSNAVIGSNIRAAASFLQRETGRQFERQDATAKTFTTNGLAAIRVPDLRSVTSITQQGVALDANESYYLLPDNMGGYTGVQFRSFGQGGTASYKSNPEWFDRNLDRDWNRYGYTSLPNDLVITGNWGWDPYPYEFLHAVKVLAGFYTRRPASVLADASVTPEGTELRYSQLPVEVREFIRSWRLGAVLAAV